MYTRINTLKQLKEDCENEQKGYFIHFGAARSSKTIEYDPEDDTFTIFNDIDGSEQVVSSAYLVDETNIIKAIYAGNFYNDKWLEPTVIE